MLLFLGEAPNTDRKGRVVFCACPLGRVDAAAILAKVITSRRDYGAAPRMYFHPMEAAVMLVVIVEVECQATTSFFCRQNCRSGAQYIVFHLSKNRASRVIFSARKRREQSLRYLRFSESHTSWTLFPITFTQIIRYGT